MPDAFCTHCGKRIGSYDAFCPGCGQPQIKVSGLPSTPQEPGRTKNSGLATAIILNVLLYVGVTCLLSFGAVSLVKWYKNKDTLSGTYATQDMINLGMTNGMGLTFYPNGTFIEKTGGISQDLSGTYKLSGNTLIIDPNDPVRAQGNNPVMNGFLQSMNGTVSDDRQTVNWAGGTWIKTN